MQYDFIVNRHAKLTQRKIIVIVFALLCVWATSTNAQRRRVLTSPEIAEDGQVTFRILATKAESVELSAQWSKERIPFVKGDEGVWQVTVGPVPAGVWEYSFRVDELSMIDPRNPLIKPMRSPRTSILHIPGKPPLVHDFQNVPHGVVHSHTYHSQSLDKIRELSVYTPPGYDAQGERKFPTLFLQHGSGDNQATWTIHGKAHWIIDNLIAEKKAKPMVVVMMDGHASPPGTARERRNEYFEKDLINDVLEYVQARYRVEPAANRRAIVGLSMGGGQSLAVGLNHTDKFAWVGAFSAAPPRTEELAAIGDPATTNQRLDLLWIACGKDDFLLNRNEQFIEQLKENKIDHEWYLTEGDHSWPVWRRYLADFIPRLFQ